MSEQNITVLSDVVLVTCVVESGKGEAVVKAARDVGASGALIHSQHGVGIRERIGLLGIAVDAEKDVVTMLVGSDQAELVARTIFSAVKLGRPGAGYLHLTPLDAAATYVSADMHARLKEKKQ